MIFIKKKSLGQHFLRSEAALSAIVDALAVGLRDVVVEIGPGEGILTEKLLYFAEKVLAIEKDSRLIPILEERFAKEVELNKLHIVGADALTFEPELELRDTRHLKGKNTNKNSASLKTYIKEGFTYKVVGNIPYYITGALLRKFLETTIQPTKLVFLMQKEVAERIVGRKDGKNTNKESLLSLSVKAYGTPRYIKTVPRGAFTPAPTVDSAILLVDHISRENFKNLEHEERFFELIHAGFAQKRKLLLRNVEALFSSKEAVHEALSAANISVNTRAEDVSVAQWLQLAEH